MPSKMWQNSVGLGSVAFVWEARQWRKMQNFHRVSHNVPMYLSRFWVKGHDSRSTFGEHIVDLH